MQKIPLQTIEADEKKQKVFALHSTISPADKLGIVTDHFGKGVQEINTETKIASGKSVDTETKIASGKSVDTETKIASGKSVDIETKIASGKSVDTETKIASGKSVDTETKIARGKSVDTETKIASGKSVDTETKIASGKSVDTETKIASGKSVDAEEKIASGMSVPTSHRPREVQTARILEHGTSTCPAVITKASIHDTQARTDTTAAHRRSSSSQTQNYTPQDWCKEAYASLKNNEGFTFDQGFMYDNLQEKDVMELTNCATINSIDIAGFKTYGIPGVETADLYLLISHLLCGNNNLKGTLQLAAARYGIQHFDTYLKALLKEFNQSKTPLIEARIFFELHGIYFNDFTSPLTEESVCMALDNLLHQLAVTGSTGPFHAALLGCVLHCNLTQHFENNQYHDRDVRTTAGFKLALESSQSCSRELHIVWMKSANYPHRYCVIPAFTSDGTNIAKETHIPYKHNEGMVKTLIENIKEQEPYKWISCFEVFEQSKKDMFDDLKGMEFIKPDRIIRTINVPGYKAYTKPRGGNTSVYEWLSLMLCGDQSLMYILRLAAARYAINHFETYVDKLNDKFNGDFYAAKTFFKSHEIGFAEKERNVKGCVSVAFRNLVNETVNANKGNAPFYVEFLSGVLNRKIIQHFENNTFDGRHVESICGLDVSLKTELSSDRELHMYWMKSSNQLTYQIVPLFPCNPKSNGKDLCGDVYKLLMGQVTFESGSCLQVIDAHGINVFEELKEHAILKPTTVAKRVINTITIPGYIGYERTDGETTCLYEHTSRLLFGNTEKKFILRLAAIRYALQNYSKYVKQVCKKHIHVLLVLSSDRNDPKCLRLLTFAWFLPFMVVFAPVLVMLFITIFDIFSAGIHHFSSVEYVDEVLG
ncbi:uncharacterized protein LOC127840662 [Dreissena polymorpha]|uniref:uncharacterized protein LOC127840662 n=1 Tax=Dreissena polymorpha TaxID=45954 RepID=UPI0022644A7B|nr:uncharacterized protein LOC127840662 [Dreissena polymorpha]